MLLLDHFRPPVNMQYLPIVKFKTKMLTDKDEEREQ